MIRFQFFVIGILLSAIAYSQANTPINWQSQELLARRMALQQQALRHIQKEDSLKVRYRSTDTKSIGKSVLFSLVLPGSGQFYANSYIKSALFLAVEASAWAINVSYNKRGDDKDAEFKRYANQHWSEQRYFSYLYYQFGDEIASEVGRELNTNPDNVNRPILTDEDYKEYKETIREWEDKYSHRLPKGKTQQYYEMIGKYPHQFGNAWDDASFDVEYLGPDKITPHNDFYMEMREESNRLYDIARYGTMAALINHVISAIDAGFTTRSYNRSHTGMEMSYDNVKLNGEYVNMLGVNLRW